MLLTYDLSISLKGTCKLNILIQSKINRIDFKISEVAADNFRKRLFLVKGSMTACEMAALYFLALYIKHLQRRESFCPNANFRQALREK